MTEQARAQVQRAAVAAGAAGRTPSLLMLMQTPQAGVDVPRVAEAAARNGRGELLKALSGKVDGALALEESCAWAVPAAYTAPELNNQFHCFEGGENCVAK